MGSNCIGFFQGDQHGDRKAVEAQIQKNMQKNVKRKENKLKVLVGHHQEQLKIYQKVQIVEKAIQKADIPFILKSLANHFLFSQLTSTEKQEIARQMFYCQANQNSYVFKQGDKAATFFILQKGQCQVFINDQFKKKLSPGCSFGQLALLYGVPRSASIKTVQLSSFWAISRHQFKKAVQQISSRNFVQILQILKKIKLFDFMTESQKEAIANIAHFQKYKIGDHIVIEGQIANSYYIIKQGSVVISFQGKEIKKMNSMDCFGQQALHSENSKRTMTVTAFTNVQCLSISRQSIISVIGDKVSKIIIINRIRWAFQTNQNIRGLNKLQLDKLMGHIKITSKKKGEVIMRKQEMLQSFYLTSKGNLVNQQDRVLSEQYKIFGFEIIKSFVPKVINFNILTSQDCQIAQLQVFKLQQVFNSSTYRVKQKQKTVKEFNNFKLQNFIFSKRLGSGQFGKVFLAHNEVDKKQYAIKCVLKNQVQILTIQQHVINQKKTLQICNHPFIVQYYCTFKDNYNVYFVTQFINGTQLYYIIREIGLLTFTQSRFYIASILLAIYYLHDMKIVHRDIKPQNIIIDQRGYPKLIDMGTAKSLATQTGKTNRTFTIIGTPHYMAPQIISGKGYGLMVDLWSIGICLYQFMCGSLPFAQDTQDPFQVYQQILNKNVNYPSFFSDKQTKKLLTQLINKVPQARLGGSYQALMNSRWFQGLDFQLLHGKNLQPPFIPRKHNSINKEQIKFLMNQGKKYELFVQRQFDGQKVDKPYEWQKFFE